MRGGPRVWVGVKWVGIRRCTITRRERYSTVIYFFQDVDAVYQRDQHLGGPGLTLCFLETALRMTGKALWHVPPLCSFNTLISRILYCIALCGANNGCLYSREPRKQCPSRKWTSFLPDTQVQHKKYEGQRTCKWQTKSTTNSDWTQSQWRGFKPYTSGKMVNRDK